MQKIILSTFIAFCFSTTGFALVDYTEPPPAVRNQPRPKVAPLRRIERQKPRVRTSRSSSTKSFIGEFHLATSYEAININTAEIDDQVSMLKVGGHFRTKYNLFLDFAFWRASSRETALASTTSSKQNGNPLFLLGFNWLRNGNAADLAVLDIYFGMQTKGKSDFASSRDDRIIGLETSKRFGQFALALKAELRLTGTPENSEHTDIGNIRKLNATLGWRATPDIHFVLDGGTYKLNSGDLTQKNFLVQDVSFGYLSPQVILGLAPMVNLTMGANFRTKRAPLEDILDTKVWDLAGAYGTTLFAGMQIAI